MARLTKNQVLTTLDVKNIKVIDKLGEGGQGIVYKIKCENKNYALKWYKKPCDDSFYKNLCDNVKRGAPAATFLWPLAITEKDSDGSFGYVMKLCPKRYQPLSQFLLNNAKFKNLSAMINAGIQITASFRALHNKGDSYQDLNDGNFFIDPETGKILICDNDNVAPNGTNLGILGKPRYMAPEVVCQNHLPDTYSDRFSLAVILFLLFFRGHPLEGMRDNCDREDNEKSLFCKMPIFVFDPNDSTNRPNPAIHRNVNVGNSGGERKKNEIFQMRLLEPKFIILDELDSGLDIDSLKVVCDNINDYLKEFPKTSILIITHYPRILEYIKPDYVHIMMNGKIVKTGDYTLALNIEKNGYNEINNVNGNGNNE